MPNKLYWQNRLYNKKIQYNVQYNVTVYNMYKRRGLYKIQSTTNLLWGWEHVLAVVQGYRTTSGLGWWLELMRELKKTKQTTIDEIIIFIEIEICVREGKVTATQMRWPDWEHCMINVCRWEWIILRSDTSFYRTYTSYISIVFNQLEWLFKD